jgi:hypothetical protein
LALAAPGEFYPMPNPLNTLTKPLQIGVQIAFGAIQGVQQALQELLGGARQDDPQPEPQRQEPRAEPKPPAARRPPKPKALDDKTITDKVETILFRDDRVAKGKIDVNTADGVVWLRGEAKTPEQIRDLEAKAAAIPEVKQVENLLHLPKTPAPKRTRRTKQSPAKRKVTTARVTSERKTSRAAAEPTPKELAKKREGRKPAPLGSNGSSGGS